MDPANPIVITPKKRPWNQMTTQNGASVFTMLTDDDLKEIDLAKLIPDQNGFKTKRIYRFGNDRLQTKLYSMIDNTNQGNDTFIEIRELDFGKKTSNYEYSPFICFNLETVCEVIPILQSWVDAIQKNLNVFKKNLKNALGSATGKNSFHRYLACPPRSYEIRMIADIDDNMLLVISESRPINAYSNRNRERLITIPAMAMNNLILSLMRTCIALGHSF